MNVALLRSSFETIVQREPEVTTRFYEVLFTRYPAAKPLFGRNSSRSQAEMLQQALVAVVQNVEDAAWLTGTLPALGAKHVAYGVTPEMYAWVGDALLTTLAEALGTDWTTDVAETWTAAYGAIQGLMLSETAKAAS